MAKRQGLKKKELPRDPYGSDISLWWGPRDALNSAFKRRFGAGTHEIKPGVRANFAESQSEHCAPKHIISVVCDVNTSRFEKVCSLSHELIHVSLAILEHRGVVIHSNSDEAFAYYYEWLFRAAARELWDA